jgi:DNA-binding IclR family transcriptional regulator
MSSLTARTLAILERLAHHVHGVPLATLADDLGMPRSGAHRLLTELCALGYVRQSRERGTYMLTTRLVSLGLNFLKTSGVVDICQPILDRLAESCGELVRLAVVDVDHITWVGLSQGARSGLRYDPDMGIDAKLSCTSSGFIWLSTLAEDDAIALLSRQGIGTAAEYGPNAPGSVQAVLEQVALARQRGYGTGIETYARGLSAIATTICPNGRDAVGVLAISGPTVRLGEARLHALAPDLMAAAADIAAISSASPLFDRAHARPDPQP